MRELLLAFAASSLLLVIPFAQIFASPIASGATLSDATINAAVIPGPYKTPTDKADDAPSIQRAINALCTKGGGSLNLQARHYALRSPITQTCAIKVNGQGWQEAPPKISTAAGTWLDIDQNAASAWTITTIAAKGSEFRDLAVDEPGQPAPVATGAWTPVPYPYVFNVNNIGGKVDFNDIFMDGVFNGIRAFNTGRLEINELLGQWLNNAILLDRNEDVDHINNIHDWPYYSGAAPVIAYTQANATGLIMNRVDTPFLDQLFFYGIKSGIRLSATSYGVTTKAKIGALVCDSAQYCLDVQAAGTSASIAMLDSDGQAGIASGTPLAGSAAIHFGPGGQGIIQVGNITTQSLDAAVITNADSAACSNVMVSEILADFRASKQSAVSIYAAPSLCGGVTNALSLGMNPAVILNNSIGQRFSNASGPGVTVFPAFQVVPLQTLATSPPACTASTLGMVATITNSRTMKPGAAVNPGGTDTVLEWCNGAHYIVLQ